MTSAGWTVVAVSVVVALALGAAALGYFGARESAGDARRAAEAQGYREGKKVGKRDGRAAGKRDGQTDGPGGGQPARR